MFLFASKDGKEHVTAKAFGQEEFPLICGRSVFFFSIQDFNKLGH